MKNLTLIFFYFSSLCLAVEPPKIDTKNSNLDKSNVSLSDEVDWFEPNIVSKENEDEEVTDTLIEIIARTPEEYDLQLDPRGALYIDTQKKITKIPLKTVLVTREKNQEDNKTEFTFRLNLQPGLSQVPFILFKSDKSKRFLRLSFFVDADKVKAVGSLMKKKEIIKDHQWSIGMLYQDSKYNFNIPETQTDLSFSYKSLGTVKSSLKKRISKLSFLNFEGQLQPLKLSSGESIQASNNRIYLLSLGGEYEKPLIKRWSWGLGLRFLQLPNMQREAITSNSVSLKASPTIPIVPKISYTWERKKWQWQTQFKYFYFLPFGELSPKNILSYEASTKFGKLTKNNSLYGLYLGFSQTKIKIKSSDPLSSQSYESSLGITQSLLGAVYEKSW